ncbi:Hypothetical nudix hydrolase YeaB [Pseudoalteromonas luteoviolacea B = ATCC 29581]|nr:Hypothetical nudix hydrolase YeaB [Pseudoalteromonas luteoviolacea B = ATCC 29581]
MQYSEFLTRFLLKQSTSKPTKAAAHLRQSAVLVPVIEIKSVTHFLLCKRPTYLTHHPGQICFPGGKVDPTDHSLIHTAIRECHEELDIPANNVTILGQMDQIKTATGFAITPIVAAINWPVSLRPNPQEVESTFLFSINNLKNKQNWQRINVPVQGRTIPVNGQMTEHGLLWGATAKILHNLLDHIE